MSDKVQTVILNHDHLIIQTASGEDAVRYDQVSSVRLSKSKNVYTTKIYLQNFPPITITNRYTLPEGKYEDRSRQYSSFVRILHYYLKDRGTAVFTFGLNYNRFIAWTLVSALLSFIISFVSEYFNLSIVNPFVQAIALTFLVTVIIALVSSNTSMRKYYSPIEIPSGYLPS